MKVNGLNPVNSQNSAEAPGFILSVSSVWGRTRSLLASIWSYRFFEKHLSTWLKLFWSLIGNNDWLVWQNLPFSLWEKGWSSLQWDCMLVWHKMIGKPVFFNPPPSTNIHNFRLLVQTKQCLLQVEFCNLKMELVFSILYCNTFLWKMSSLFDAFCRFTLAAATSEYCTLFYARRHSLLTPLSVPSEKCSL